MRSTLGKPHDRGRKPKVMQNNKILKITNNL